MVQMCANANLDTTDWDWAIDPIGLEYLFRDIYMRYNKPIMITENGLGAFDAVTEDGKLEMVSVSGFFSYMLSYCLQATCEQ